MFSLVLFLLEERLFFQSVFTNHVSLVVCTVFQTAMICVFQTAMVCVTSQTMVVWKTVLPNSHGL